MSSLELPCNLAFRRVGAARWLGTVGLLWGAVMLGMGFVKTWQQLAVCRALLGMLEVRVLCCLTQKYFCV